MARVHEEVKIPQKKKPSTPKPLPPRRYYSMSQRIVDSLTVTPGAVAALHPEDQAFFRKRITMGKTLMAINDPKTGEPLPFPYAYPSRYAADIRRLDSIKNVQQADSSGRK